VLTHPLAVSVACHKAQRHVDIVQFHALLVAVPLCAIVPPPDVPSVPPVVPTAFFVTVLAKDGTVQRPSWSCCEEKRWKTKGDFDHNIYKIGLQNRPAFREGR
jgi:hypothetical protein